MGALRAELARAPRPIGIVLKIETRAGFDALRRILLAAMRTPAVGVMIACGDIECGFERQGPRADAGAPSKMTSMMRRLRSAGPD